VTLVVGTDEDGIHASYVLDVLSCYVNIEIHVYLYAGIKRWK